MQLNNRFQESKSDKVVAVALTVFSTFVVGYTFTRVFLSSFSPNNTNAVIEVIPHQSTMWSDVGR